MARFTQKADRTLAITQVKEKQLSQVHIVIWLGGVDEKTLLVIRGSLRGPRPWPRAAFFPARAPWHLLPHSPQELVGLILLRMLLDDFLQHLDRLAALVGQDKTGGELFPRVRVVRLEFQHPQVERDRLRI